MEGFVRGDIVIVEFPFSNLQTFKRRPVLVLKVPRGDDVIVAQMTGSSYEPSVEELIGSNDFNSGGLKREGFVRIDKVASIEKFLIKYKAGSIKREKLNKILDKICSFLRS